jgi:phosphatidylinositol alpha-1,6-mannosyltransferase
MKVLALVTDAFGGEGGIARFNRELLSAVSAMPGVERIDVLCRGTPRGFEAPPSNIRQATPAGERAGYVARALARAAAPARYGCVLCSHMHLAPVAAAAAALQRSPLWLQLHGLEAWSVPGPLRRWAVARAALVTAVSRCTRARFLEWADCEPHRVRVLPAAVDGRFAPGPKSAALAERLGVRGRRVLLTVSRIDRGDRYKGHATVLRALAQIAPDMPDLHYLVVGDGDDRPHLEQMARQLGLAERVHFAGHIADAELPDCYRLADVFVMPSDGEGFGIVFVEAAASGVAVVGGNRDGSLDALADGAIGVPVDGRDPGAVGLAIRAALAAGPRSVRATRFAPDNFRRHVAGIARQLLH